MAKILSDVKKGISSFSHTKITDIIVGAGLIGAFQVFNIGGKIQSLLMKTPLASVFSKVKFSYLMLGTGAGMMFLRRKSKFGIEKAVYVAMATIGAMDTAKELILKIKNR